jgi:hypothetical protein
MKFSYNAHRKESKLFCYFHYLPTVDPNLIVMHELSDTNVVVVVVAVVVVSIFFH